MARAEVIQHDLVVNKETMYKPPAKQSKSKAALIVVVMTASNKASSAAQPTYMPVLQRTGTNDI